MALEGMTGKVPCPVTHSPSLLSQGSFAQLQQGGGMRCNPRRCDASKFSQLHAVLYHRGAAGTTLSTRKFYLQAKLEFAPN